MTSPRHDISAYILLAGIKLPWLMFRSVVDLNPLLPALKQCLEGLGNCTQIRKPHYPREPNMA